jgi:outer membrane murein-binding lipoprotein Lpp
MRIFLRILVCLLLVLSIVTLLFGVKLASMRDLLKGRTAMYEDHMQQLAKTIETTPTMDSPPPNYEAPTAWDDFSFWEEYIAEGSVNLEEPNMLRISPDLKRAHYYRPDPALPEKDWKNDIGAKSTIGKGTLHNELTNIVQHSLQQNLRLGDTRAWLAKSTKALESSIAQYNVTYSDLQDAKAQIKGLEENVDQLEGNVRGLQSDVQDLETERDDLKGELQDSQDEADRLNDEVNSKEVEITRLDTVIQDLRKKLGQQSDTNELTEIAGPVVEVTPGPKGEIVYIDPTTHFAILAVLEGADLAPGAKLTAHRPESNSDEPTGNLIVTEIPSDSDKAIADVSLNLSLRAGDKVFF